MLFDVSPAPPFVFPGGASTSEGRESSAANHLLLVKRLRHILNPDSLPSDADRPDPVDPLAWKFVAGTWDPGCPIHSIRGP